MNAASLPLIHGLPRRTLSRAIGLVLAGAAVTPLVAGAGQVTLLPQIDVVGASAEGARRQPGAVSLVSSEELDQLQPASTEEALRRVTGVHIKPEEESAIVANIGVRGLSSADYKTLILEDGVPIAPGLFVGNGRYYNPRIQRIGSIEVLKGAASLRYGPSTIGGVINYRTKQPRDGVQVDLSAGSFNTSSATAEIGATSPTGEGLFGAVLSRVESDGFMDKGYVTSDAMIKGGTAISDTQWLGVKFTYYENEANISYRGLFLDDYEAGETYNPAPDDYYLTGRTSFDVNHSWEINARASLNTVFYWSEMYRDYWRFAVDAADSTNEGRWVYTDDLDGNNRAFERLGFDTRLRLLNDLLGVPGEAELGLRYMREEMHDQRIAAQRATPRSGDINRDRIDIADSVALFAQNRFALTERLAVTPGLRAEFYEQSRKDLRSGDGASTSNTEFVPGVGATYDLGIALQLFGGVYSAFSPALNGDALDGLEDQQLKAERSVNMELGLRGGDDALSYEVAVFRMEFDNQIIPANSNSNFQRTNGGETLHQGIEAGIDMDLMAGFSLMANATWVADAQFVGDRFEPDGVTLDTPDGNRIPYTPEWVANLGLGYKRGPSNTLLSVNYTGSQFTDVENTRAIAENTSGFFTGKVDSYTTLDLSTRYAVSDQLELNAKVGNLTDERYIASLRQGIYAGPERNMQVGLRYRF